MPNEGAGGNVVYLTADQEEAKVIAQANAEIDDKGHFIGKVTVRKDGEFLEVPAGDVHYMDVSPKQVVSVATAVLLGVVAVIGAYMVAFGLLAPLWPHAPFTRAALVLADVDGDGAADLVVTPDRGGHRPGDIIPASQFRRLPLDQSHPR